MNRWRRRQVLAGAGSLLAGLSGCVGRIQTPGSESGTTTTADAPDRPVEGSVHTYRYDRPNTGRANAPGPTGTPEMVGTVPIEAAIRTHPAVDGGVAYLGGIRGELVAADLSAGEPLWSKAGREERSLVADSMPAIDSGRVFYATLSGTVVARSTDGAHAWTFEADQRGREVYGTGPVVVGDRVVANRGDGLYAIDARDGALEWKLPVSDFATGAPAVADGVVYYARLHDHLSAVEASSGRALWNYDPDDAAPQNPPAVADGVVYLTRGGDNADGYDGPTVVALDAEDGTEVWTQTTEMPVDAPAAVADGTVYVLDSRGGLYALDAADGAELWRTGTGRANGGAPTVAGGRIHVVRVLGNSPVTTLEAYDPDGNRQWRVEPGFDWSVGPLVVDDALLLVEDRRIGILR